MELVSSIIPIPLTWRVWSGSVVPIPTLPLVPSMVKASLVPSALPLAILKFLLSLSSVPMVNPNAPLWEKPRDASANDVESIKTFAAVVLLLLSITFAILKWN